MSIIQDRLAQEKEIRDAQMQKNSEIRNKIQTAINEYNVKETAYQDQMKVYQGQMQKLEQKFKTEIEG